MSAYSCNCPECRDEALWERAIDQWENLVNNPVVIDEADIDPIDLLIFPEPADARDDLAAQADEAWRLTMADWNAA